ncbi:hypothetical protein T440DRAFT_494693 [Plenodomus tracheiphilus IPT5]|uniref:Rhodopsin domain-containing protein n=1 Tax=Plenodomus tracheiphilus IPT5 TaxID=1408161 RepID=A0A6A7BNL6_9PLEO|nr:hypothetical protein T440DRAFT_494693 [Plenodomus tracheiphilus IPT5]
MRLPPYEVLLSWPTPNYDNPVTRGNALVVVNSIFLGLVIITVGLRLYTRVIIKRWFGLDDIFILLALLFTIGLTTVVLLANRNYGWDRHVYDIPLKKLVPTSKIAMSAKVVFTAAATFTRLSLHCFYYRLVADSGKIWFKWLIHANVVYTIGIFISFTFIAVFLCDPVKNYWTLSAPIGTCMDEGVVTLVCGIINCVADFATTITPIPLVMRLHMPRRQRVAVAFLFGLGIIVTVAGIVRTWFIYQSLIKSYDQTWYAYPLWIAAAVEIDLGVICASAPVLRPLLAKIPFSLSSTFSRGISFGRSSNSASSAQNPSRTSKAPNASATSSSRKSGTLNSIPELGSDRGKSYELKHWDDAERRILASEDIERGSQEAILDNEVATEEQPKQGVARLWQKIRNPESSPCMTEDMTITRTSEFELQSEPATGPNSKNPSQRASQQTPQDLASTRPVVSLKSRYS